MISDKEIRYFYKEIYVTCHTMRHPMCDVPIEGQVTLYWWAAKGKWRFCSLLSTILFRSFSRRRSLLWQSNVFNWDAHHWCNQKDFLSSSSSKGEMTSSWRSACLAWTTASSDHCSWPRSSSHMWFNMWAALRQHPSLCLQDLWYQCYNEFKNDWRKKLWTCYEYF